MSLSLYLFINVDIELTLILIYKYIYRAKSLLYLNYSFGYQGVSYNKEREYRDHYMSYRGVGYGNVAAKAADPIRSKIKLNSKVVEVNSEGEMPSILCSFFGIQCNNDNSNLQTVKYVDENGEMKSVNAKTVVITVSLGVLKAGVIKFVPPLPNWKQEVIDSMEMGLHTQQMCNAVGK